MLHDSACHPFKASLDLLHLGDQPFFDKLSQDFVQPMQHVHRNPDGVLLYGQHILPLSKDAILMTREGREAA